MIYHYVYRITNLKLNKHYYGVRTSKIKPDLDLGKKYFSSSKDKNFILDQKNNAMHYKYKIIKIYNNRKRAISTEIKLHNKFNVGKNSNFYNKSKQTSTGWDTTGTSWTMTELGKQNIKNALEKRGGMHGSNNPRYGVKLDQITRDKISFSVRNNGYTDSTETRMKKSLSAKNRPPVSEETRNKISNIHKGKKISNETIQKMINTKKSRVYEPNYNSLMVNIYDNFMNLMFECSGDFNKICQENTLPNSALRNSLRTNAPIYNNLNGGNLAKVTKNGMIKYKGWIAKYRI